jgi:subtilase family serine protease
VDSGGGISPDAITIPSWQTGAINSSNKGSTTLRNGPDVSANANFSFYVCADQTTCTSNAYGGTSFAAPMWAGLVALANQQAALNGKSRVGFINPTIYAQNATSSYSADFHDITSGTSGSYSAVTGYDLVTGWGSPNSGLINALLSTTTSPTPSFTMSASPAAVSVLQGNSGTSTITTAVSGGFNSAISLSASGAPTGVTVGFSANPIAAPGSGSASVTLAVASTTVAGTYTITVTGTGGGLTHTAAISLTVTAPTTGAFTIAVSPTAGYLRRGTSGSATITTKVTGGFSSAIALSASGQPSGVTLSFSPTSITGAGTAQMLLTVSGSAATGTYPITITGTGGGTTHTAVLSFQITR